MPIEVLFPPGANPVGDLVGILIAETQFCGIINNKPLRRRAVPYETLDIYKNNNRRLRVYIRDGDLNIVNISGAVAYLTVRHTKDGPISFQKSTLVPAQGMIGSADQGEIFFFIVPTDTATLDIAQYVFDVKVVMPGPLNYTTVEGVINLLQPVT